jgi:GLPGLI family protein
MKEIGRYKLTVDYRYLFAMDTVSGKRYEDMCRLEIGDFTRYYSLYALRCDSLMYEARMSSGDPNDGVNVTNWMGDKKRANYEDYYLDYPSKGSLTARINIVNTEYEYCEPLPIFEWKFLPDSVSTKVLGYECNAAETSFRGRHYRVWFTMEIPFSFGPWKFRGLPGLILKVEESTGMFSWEAEGISQESGPIYLYTPSFVRRTGRSQVDKLKRKEWDDPDGLAAQHGMTGGNMILELNLKSNTKKLRAMTAEDRERLRRPYVPPLELE